MRTTLIRLLLGVGMLTAGQESNGAKPNILLILTDDQGWSTLGCYGGELVATPNLDRLASEGARFTDAYVTSQCTPTRATLLSGQYTARNGMWHVVPWYGCPWALIAERPFVEQFPRNAATIASELRQAGYVTGIMGKWHLTTGRDGSYQGLRPERAHYYGFDYAAPLLEASEFKSGGDRGVGTLTRQAIDFISNNRERPWFCFLSHHMIHGNVVAPSELEDKYRDLGFGDEGPNRAVYLAGLECIDRSVGMLMSRLETLGEADETVVVFLSDNGGIDQRLEHRSLAKPHPPAPLLRPNMAEYDNTPLRAGKGSIYEGGIRVPLIIRWPDVVVPGTVVREPVHAVDLAPTFFQIAGHAKSERDVLDGVDLSQALETGKDSRLADRPVYQYCPIYDLNWGLTPCASVRQGDLKLIEFFGDRFDARHQYVAGHRIELYNLRDDIGETKNLAAMLPERSTELLGLLHSWMQDLGVSSTGPNPHHTSSRAFETTSSKPNWLLRDRSTSRPR